ncbi:MAG TPA: hypothetical protein ENN17_13220 [bacterium]|nr:hypothetical protein [bacterium]
MRITVRTEGPDRAENGFRIREGGKLDAFDWRIDKHVLDRAKAFLCWDTFQNLSIQLIEISSVTGYFLPPERDRSTIVLFYRPGNPDYSRPLFLLFHEAGHCIQYEEWERTERTAEFHKHMETGTGAIQYAFEKEAWDWGRDILKDFLARENLDGDLLEKYDTYSAECLASYR